MQATRGATTEPVSGDQRPDDPLAERSITKTILFIDVVASTNFSRVHGDDHWRVVLYRHERAVEAIAHRYGGTVVSFLGDGFMLLFDDAGAAVTCAIRLHLANDVQQAFDVRMGLDVGEILPYGHGSYVGYTIHVASRITDLSGAGEITMSDECHRQAVQTIALPPTTEREVALRGCDGPVTVHSINPSAAGCHG